MFDMGKIWTATDVTLFVAAFMSSAIRFIGNYDVNAEGKFLWEILCQLRRTIHAIWRNWIKR
ncbi:hypothetical protein OESDEN_13689 [Oesophagostomum dentatum]|uniref:Uncharacterized protein n=1 Tax=Oesophagostomum dentatum TaxID=61180 RepID=A0A0B1SNP3_OESDE|nr:hypothetical protein OESDEN_13689 [Oesophagostomum dentatum]